MGETKLNLLDRIEDYKYLKIAIEEIAKRDSNISLPDMLIANFGMTEDEILAGDFSAADEVARISYMPDDFEDTDKKPKEEDGFLYRNTQFIIDLLMVICFVSILIALLFFDIPKNNREILLVLIGALVKTVSQATNYYRGTSFSSYIKTKSMIKDKR